MKPIKLLFEALSGVCQERILKVCMDLYLEILSIHSLIFILISLAVSCNNAEMNDSRRKIRTRLYCLTSIKQMD
jgi:hypothetical protein